MYSTIFPTQNVKPLCHDVETAVAERGRTKAGMDKMHEIDNFLREAQRVNATLVRLALRPFTFSNGVTVPAGTLIAAPTGAIHEDGEIIPNPKRLGCRGETPSNFYVR
ncbi:hypothetical protein BJY52DRAFT_1388038 [Lactarius psammicola]|nr:hypothetical protein BJY52DRAFT_1388038 [Lactarius psammicola]